MCALIFTEVRKRKGLGGVKWSTYRYAPPPPPPPPSEPKPTRIYVYPSVALVTHTQPFSWHGVLLPPPPSVQPTSCSGNLEAEQVGGKESPIASLTSTPSREGRERGEGMRRKCSSRTALKNNRLRRSFVAAPVVANRLLYFLTSSSFPGPPPYFC